ncbi:MAG TPA: NADH-quinone oxidoreductase subunit J [Thermoanaerobaculia bacterium]|nr:NADH-quinone oxidoreductase subunit J [Thermoanaerobaculia bacterium]
MSGADLLFYLFAALALGAAVLVVSLRNPMYGAISLLATFLSIAALFLLRHAEFVAAVQIFVYGGGIMVLFLFVIMLVNLHRMRETTKYDRQTPLAAVLGVLLVALFVTVFAAASFGPPLARPEVFTAGARGISGNTQAVAWVLYRDYLLPFEIASLFLLIAMIGAVVLGRRT